MVDLIAAGEAFDDFVFYGLDALPASGRELKTDAFVRTPGGGAVISAVAAARLGARVAVVSALSRETAACLRRERIAFVNLRRRDESPALTVSLSTRRDRRFVTFNGVNLRLPQRILACLPRLRARHVHFALDPGRCRVWVRPLQRLRERGATTSWDFGWNPRLARDPDFARMTAELDCVFLNRDEAALYEFRPGRGLAIVKLGRRGCRAIGPGVDLRVAGRRVRALDTTGAGDVFDGTFLAARLRGEPLGAALRIANRAAAESTRHPGGVPVVQPFRAAER